MVNVVSSYGLPWQKSFGIIVILYFYSHYLFASGAAHIGAMYTAFLSVAVACGTPGMLAAIALGQVPFPVCTPCSPGQSWYTCTVLLQLESAQGQLQACPPLRHCCCLLSSLAHAAYLMWLHFWSACCFANGAEGAYDWMTH